MKIAYASRTGNCESIVKKLDCDNIFISSGNEVVNEDILLLTYTDGYGLVPVEVEEFVKNNKEHIKGIIASGDKSFGEAFCGAGVTLSEELNVPLIKKIENSGTDEDINSLKEEIEKINE